MKSINYLQLIMIVTLCATMLFSGCQCSFTHKIEHKTNPCCTCVDCQCKDCKCGDCRKQK